MAKKMGRPLKEIDWVQFEKLCGIQATEIEISEWFHCSVDTVERACKRQYGETFADVYKKKASSGKISLRRKQFEVAIGGNVTMLIWLGKQHLGQRDNIELPPQDNKKPTQINYVVEEKNESASTQTPVSVSPS